MRLKKKQWDNFLIYIFLFDMCIMPITHIEGIPFKISFVICALWFFGVLDKVDSCVRDEKFIDCSTNRHSVLNSKYGRRLILCVFIIVVMTILGELTLIALSEVTNTNGLRNYLFGYFILVAFMGMGYRNYGFNKDFMLIILFIYCFLNILLSALKSNAPFYIRYLYGMVGEANEATSFTLRFIGTLGNPNATLTLMNSIFMSIIVFYSKNLLKINSVFKLIIIMILPLITHLFVNSRGEFLVTIFLEGVLFYTALVKQRTIIKRIRLSLIACVMAIIGLIILWFVFMPRFPTVKYSIERNYSIVTMEHYERLGGSESITERPFIFMEEFIDRFLVSPLWGTGIDSGNQYPFIVPSIRYHNDWYNIFASSGIIGGMALVYMVYLSVRKCGLICMVPFVVTAISNTFLKSYYAIGIFFMTVMVVVRYNEMKEDMKERGSSG